MRRAFRNTGDGGPCMGCAERYPGCHDHCERYRAWHAKVLEAHRKEREYRISMDVMSENKKRTVWRKMRYRSKDKPAR